MRRTNNIVSSDDISIDLYHPEYSVSVMDGIIDNNPSTRYRISIEEARRRALKPFVRNNEK